MLTGQWGRKMRGEIFANEYLRQQSVQRQQLKWGHYYDVKKIVRRLLSGDQNVCKPILEKSDWTVFGTFYGISRTVKVMIGKSGRMYPPSFPFRKGCPINWSVVYRKGRTSNGWKDEKGAYRELVDAGYAPNQKDPELRCTALLRNGYTYGMFFHINPDLLPNQKRG